MQFKFLGLRGALIAALALALGACVLLNDTPTQVGKTVTIDEQGRKVTIYRICETRRLPLSLATRTDCHSEKIVHNYCYRSIGKIDCYDKPIPGRVRIETEQ